MGTGCIVEDCDELVDGGGVEDDDDKDPEPEGEGCQRGVVNLAKLTLGPERQKQKKCCQLFCVIFFLVLHLNLLAHLPGL